MPIDPSIPLQGLRSDQPFDAASEYQKGFQLQRNMVNAPYQTQQLQAQAQQAQTSAGDAKTTAAMNRLTAVGSLLNNVKDQRTYTMALQTLSSAGVELPHDTPQEYDPEYVDMYRNSVASTKAKIEQQYKLAEIAQMQAGGSTGTLLNRLKADPSLMDAYMGKANANKGLISQNGQMSMAPGYNEGVASTEGAKKLAEQQAILGTAGQIESEKAQGAAAGKTLGEQDKRAINAPNNLMLISEAEKLLPQATSGLGQIAMRGAANMAGYSTDSSKADRQLNVLSAALTQSVPRMEGPQSDKDTAMYKQAAGDVGNADVPYEDRLAALQTMKLLQNKYQHLNGIDTAQKAEEPRLDAAKINAAQVGKLSTKDPRVKQALDAGYSPDEIAQFLTRGK